MISIEPAPMLEDKEKWFVSIVYCHPSCTFSHFLISELEESSVDDLE